MTPRFGKTASHFDAGLTSADLFANIFSIFNGYEKEEYFSACRQRAAGRCKAAGNEKEGSF